MTGFELHISHIWSNKYAKWATATAQSLVSKIVIIFIQIQQVVLYLGILLGRAKQVVLLRWSLKASHANFEWYLGGSGELDDGKVEVRSVVIRMNLDGFDAIVARLVA